MKLEVDLSALWANVRRMGDFDSPFELTAGTVSGVDIDRDLSSRKGLDISIDDLSLDNGLLSFEGRQVLLFIPDHGTSIDDVVDGQKEGRKFHVSDCVTLDMMRNKNRFDRYKATYNTSGSFEIFGTSYSNGNDYTAEVKLHVCKNCLKYLNYKGYGSGGGLPKKQIYGEFDIGEFLSEYSTLFRNMPNRSDMVDLGGYSDDWGEVSARYRESVRYTCESCRVNLSEFHGLLHTHHINGNKRQNTSANLMALCIDCHRKQPHHDYMRVSFADMTTLTELRREQRLISGLKSWTAIRAMADKTLDGLLRYYERNRMPFPEVGHQLIGKNSEVIAELELAWPKNRKGIAISEDALVAARRAGWTVMTVGEALRSMND